MGCCGSTNNGSTEDTSKVPKSPPTPATTPVETSQEPLKHDDAKRSSAAASSASVVANLPSASTQPQNGASGSREIASEQECYPAQADSSHHAQEIPNTRHVDTVTITPLNSQAVQFQETTHQDNPTPNSNNVAPAPAPAPAAQIDAALQETDQSVDSFDMISRTPSAEIPVVTPVSKRPEIAMGYLLKQGHVVRNWKSRFFIVDKGVLKYFASSIKLAPYGRDLKGGFDLAGYTVSYNDALQLVLKHSMDDVSMMNTDDTNIVKELVLDAKGPTRITALTTWYAILLQHIAFANSFIPEDRNSMYTQRPSIQRIGEDPENSGEAGINNDLPSTPVMSPENGVVNEHGNHSADRAVSTGSATDSVDTAARSVLPTPVQPPRPHSPIADVVLQQPRPLSAAATRAPAPSPAIPTPPPAPSNTVEESARESQIPAPNIIMGFLMKQGHLVKNWKSRYFVVDKGRLRYFVSKGKDPRIGENMKGGLDLCGYVANFVDDNKILLTHQPANSGGTNSPAVFAQQEKELLLDCQKGQDRMEMLNIWLTSLREHIDFANKVPVQQRIGTQTTFVI
jgi:hypothetical protein